MCVCVCARAWGCWWGNGALRHEGRGTSGAAGLAHTVRDVVPRVLRVRFASHFLCVGGVFMVFLHGVGVPVTRSCCKQGNPAQPQEIPITLCLLSWK